MRCIVLLILVLSQQLSWASPKTVLLASGEFPPYTSASLPGGGFLNEIIVRSFELGGATTDVIFLPWTRAFEGTRKRHFDVTGPYIYNDQRAAKFLYSDPLYELQIAAFIHKDNAETFFKQEDFIGHAWCLPRGYSTDSLQHYLNKGLMKMVRSVNAKTCVEMVARKRVTAYGADLLIGSTLLREEDALSNQVMHVPWALKKSFYHLLVSKNHSHGQEILQIFNFGLAKLKASPEWQAIHDRHGIQIKTLDVKE